MSANSSAAKSTPAACRIDIATSWDAINQSDTQRWTELARRAAGALCMTPTWARCWFDTIKPDAQLRLLIARGHDNMMVGIWPLVLVEQRNGAMRWNELTIAGGAVASGDRLGPIAATPRVRDELLRAAHVVAHNEADLAHWNELSAADTDALHRAATTPASYRVTERRPMPFATLPRTWEEYLATRSANHRQQLRRRERVARNELSLDWRINDQQQPLDTVLDQFFELHTTCWRHRGESGNFKRLRLTRFVRAMAHEFHHDNALRLHQLCDSTRTVAAILVIHLGDRACYYQSGWDPALDRISPGSLCIAQAIRCAINEDKSIFDFMRGDESYKSRWATDSDETQSTIQAVTLRGRMVLAGHDAKSLARRTVTAVAGDSGWQRTKSLLQRRTAEVPTL